MKNFKTFMTEHPSYDIPLNPAAGGFGDPMVVKKLNALMGKLTSEQFTDGADVVRQIRTSLSKIGLTFDEVPAMSEDSGSFSMPLTLYGGRFGKLPGTPFAALLQPDGIVAWNPQQPGNHPDGEEMEGALQRLVGGS